ncbi:MAG: helix-turn-helix transcriptional regulator [Oscillospiraceae bacterium]|nr:helix-turn-helix transcriptional regulator [Candidatus Equicaccousia limihippi]
MDDKFIGKRITEIRLKKNVSEYRMSLDLGHSNSYIRSITSGKALPSMTEFLYICDYFGITPKEFFDENIKSPIAIEKLYAIVKNMTEEDIEAITAMAERLSAKK